MDEGASRFAPNPAAKMILARCHEMLVRALEENRRIAHNLRPGDLDELGLGEACRNACRELQSRSKLTVECAIARELGRLPASVELNLFRILQEALTNIEKHAGATRIRVRIGLRKGFIELRIEDDGRGFGAKSKAGKGSSSGLGLTHMRERAVSLGGSCEMHASAKGGATITIRVPCKTDA